MDSSLFFQNINHEEIKKIFNNISFKKEMDINIKQILINRQKKCSLLFNLKSDECFTDGKIINIGILEEFKSLDLVEVVALIKGLVGHEASHVRWSNFQELKNFHQKIKELGYNSDISISLANILEDGRIERLLCKELKGYAKYIQFLNLKVVYGNGNLSSSDLFTNTVNTILFLSKLGRYPENFKDIFSQEEQYFIKSKIEPIVLKSILVKSHSELLSLTIEVLNILSSKFKEITSDTINEELSHFTKRNVVPGYNTAEGFIESLDNYSGIVHANGFKIDLNASDIRNISDAHIIGEDVNKIYSNLKEFFEDDFNNIIKDERFSSENYRPHTMNDKYFDNIDLLSINSVYNEENLKEPNFKYEYIDGDFTTYPSDLQFDIKLLERQFKKILERDDFLLKKQKKGRIDSSKLWKVSSVYDKNIFSKRTLLDNSEYAVYILIDLSGSMDSELKYREAINTAIKIEGSLLNLENVAVKTVGFNYINHSRLKIFKDFNEKKSRTASALFRKYTGGSNRDGFAIRVALDDLKKHNAKNKLLVVISDGRPLWGGETIEQSMLDVKNAVHKGRKDVVILSVLINEGRILDNIKECFHYMYEDKGTVMVNVKDNPEDLINTIVLYMKKLFKKR